MSKDLADARKSLQDAATSISVVAHRLIRDDKISFPDYHNLVTVLKHIGQAAAIMAHYPDGSDESEAVKAFAAPNA